MANRSSVFSVFWTVRRWSFVASLHGPGDSVAPNLDQVGISWNGESLSWALIPGVRASSTCSPKGERLRDSNIGRYPSRFYAGMVCLNLSPIFFWICIGTHHAFCITVPLISSRTCPGPSPPAYWEWRSNEAKFPTQCTKLSSNMLTQHLTSTKCHGQAFGATEKSGYTVRRSNSQKPWRPQGQCRRHTTATTIQAARF